LLLTQSHAVSQRRRLVMVVIFLTVCGDSACGHDMRPPAAVPASTQHSVHQTCLQLEQFTTASLNSAICQHLQVTSQGVRLKVEIHEIHEIQFSEVTNYRNPPTINRNPHAKKRNPTPATKSTETPPKANYRNPPLSELTAALMLYWSSSYCVYDCYEYCM